MYDRRQVLGKRGEDLAAVFFVERGFRVVSRNWRCRLGELDLVVEKGGTLHFVEVKTRRSLAYGRPEEAINGLKLRHMERTIEAYIATCVVPYQGYQADALAITLGTEGAVGYDLIEQIL